MTLTTNTPEAEAIEQPNKPPVAVDANTPEGRALLGAPPAATPPVTPPVAKPGGQEGESEDEAVGAGGNKLSGQALKDRLAREQSRIYKEVYGTDDPKKIEEIKSARAKEAAELKRLARLEDARKRSRLTGEQRTQSDIAAKDQEIQKLRDEIKTMRTSSMVEKQDQIVQAAASKFVRSEAWFHKYAVNALAEHVKELAAQDPAKLKAFTPAKMETWFQKFVEANPDFAIPKQEASAPPVAPAKTPVAPRTIEPRKRPLTQGAAPPQRRADNGAAKTIKPGQSNSMTRAELNEHLKKEGRRLPY